MAGDDVKKEVAKVSQLDHRLQTAEHSHDPKATEAAQEALQHELQSINAKGNPEYAKQVLAGLHKVDPHSHLALKDGHLQITPLETAPHSKGRTPSHANDRTMVAQATDRGSSSQDRQPPPLDDTALAIQAEQNLLRGGKDSLYDKVVKAPGNERGVLGGIFGSKSQDPNSPDTRLVQEDFQRYADQLKAKQEKGKLSPEDARDKYVLDNLLTNWSKVVPKIGGYFDGGEFVSKYSMGMNLARASGHALIDGGNNNLFDKIVKANHPYDDPKTARIDGFELNEYVEKNGKDLPEEQRKYLQTLASRMMIGPGRNDGRDWAAGLIGYDDGQNTYLTRQSIINGFKNYDLDSFVAKPFN
jgi:hypothetical protein